MKLQIAKDTAHQELTQLFLEGHGLVDRFAALDRELRAGGSYQPEEVNKPYREALYEWSSRVSQGLTAVFPTQAEATMFQKARHRALDGVRAGTNVDFHEPLALARLIELQRILERLHQYEDRPAMEKIKVLFLAANPTDNRPLKLDEEIRQITAKVRVAEHRDSLELVSRWAVRTDDLLQALLEVKPHVVHFSGHGSPAAELILLDAQGNPKPVSQEALVHLFKTLKDNVHVVVLNACHSQPQAEAIAKTIDYTVGMNRAIGDAAAIIFAASFYRAIGFGRSIKNAFDQGRAALLLEGIPEDQTPVLMTRTGVEASEVLLLNP
jgi:hypothetical protein